MRKDTLEQPANISAIPKSKAVPDERAFARSDGKPFFFMSQILSMPLQSVNGL